MTILADVTVLAYLIMFGVWGFRKGFVVSVMKFVSGFLAFILALVLLRPVTEYLQLIGFYDGFLNLMDKITHASGARESLTDGALQAGDGLFSNFLQNIATASGKLFFDTVAGTVFGFIFHVIVVLVLFTVCLFLLKALTWFLNRLASLPVLKLFNKILGFLGGVLKGGIILYLIAGVVFIFVPLEPRLGVEQKIGGSKSFEIFVYRNQITNLFFQNPF